MSNNTGNEDHGMNQPHESKTSNPATITASEIIHNEPAYNIFGEDGLDLKALARDLGRPVRILGIGGTTSEKIVEPCSASGRARASPRSWC